METISREFFFNICRNHYPKEFANHNERGSTNI